MIATPPNRPASWTERDPDSFDVMAMLEHIWEAVRVHKWIVVASVLIALASAVLYIKIWPPVYTTKALIMAESEEDLARDEFYVNWNIFRKDDPRTELQLLKSGPVLNEVIDREALTFDDVHHPLPSQLKYFWESSWVGTQYISLKESVFPPAENPYVTDDDKDRGKILDDLAASVQIFPLGESNAGEVRVVGPSPRVADIANTLLEIYMSQRLERFREEAGLALETLLNEESLTRTELVRTEMERAQYLDDNNLDIAMQRELNRIEQLSAYEVDIVKTNESIASVEASLDEIDLQLAGESDSRMLSRVEELNALRQTTKFERLSLDIALARAVGKYREDSPEVADIRANITRLDELLADEPEYVESTRTLGTNALRDQLRMHRSGLLSQLASSHAGRAILEVKVAEIETRIRELPELQLQLNEFDRQLGLLQERYQVLSLKRAQAEVSLSTAEAAMPALRVIAPARYPGSKSWPTMKIVLPAAFLIGLGLGVLGAVVRHHLAARVSASELQRSPEQIPVVASVRVPTRGVPMVVGVRGASEFMANAHGSESVPNGATHINGNSEDESGH